jgi:ABC-2 type transport system ATP-binding protein
VASPTSAVSARSLTKSYGKDRGVVDVDLEIAPGEVLGLVGANGAGKTTFMRTLLDFIRPTSGGVSVFGHDSVHDAVEVRRVTTYLPGELVVPRQLTGHDALQRYTFARAALDPARVSALAERFELDLSRRVGDLSKGNKQKLGLLLAFAPSAQLLVLDEPTSGLDPLLQREFAAIVAERANDGGTVLLSSHVMSEVEHTASRVALMRAGRLITVETMDAIRARSRRHGHVRPRAAADASALAAALQSVTEVSEVAVEHEAVDFVCTGDVDAVVKTVSRFEVSSFDVAHTELEDAFMSAYATDAAERG